MRFETFEVHGTDDRNGDVRIASDGHHLLFEGSVWSAAQPAAGRSLAAWKVPILALTAFSAGGEDAKRGLKRERFRTVQLSMALWDGPTLRTGSIEFHNVELAERDLDALASQVAALNFKWPLSSSRETAVRRLMIPGLIQRRDLLAAQGADAFMSCLDFAPRDLVAIWATSHLAHSWPLHYVLTDEGGQPLYLVLLPDRLVYVRPQSPHVMIEVPGSSITGVDLQLGAGDAANFSAFHLDTAQAAHTFWLPRSRMGEIQALYRFALTLWSYCRPFDVEHVVDEVASLDAQHQSGELDTVTFAALVQGLARRASGVEPIITYPIEEQPYLRPPAVAPQPTRGRSGPNPAQVRAAAVGVGLLTAAAGSLMDE